MLNPDFRDILSAFVEEGVEFFKASGRPQDLADVARLEQNP
jgi:hypothetical protein